MTVPSGRRRWYIPHLRFYFPDHCVLCHLDCGAGSHALIPANEAYLGRLHEKVTIQETLFDNETIAMSLIVVPPIHRKSPQIQPN
jgi:hypothetical protein